MIDKVGKKVNHELEMVLYPSGNSNDFTFFIMKSTQVIFEGIEK
jgi:hypothetical protein